jgi:hypothetical protein
MPPYEWAPGALERLPEDLQPHEALQVLAPERPRLPIPGEARGFPVLALFGRTRTGRPLAVVCRQVEGMLWHILFVRELTETERTWLSDWEEER